MTHQLPEFQMRRPGRARTNAQRQADFRKRHPDYYRRYRLQVKARVAAYEAEKAAAEQLALARAKEQPVLARQPLALPAPPVRLCLPAPSEEPMFILPAQRPERELVLVESARPEEPRRLAA